MIVFKNVSKTYKPDNKALVDATFTIEKGEFVFLIGPSGAGKTTILRLLLKDLEPDKGKITVDGENLADYKQSQLHLLRRKIGVAFQDFKLLHNRTAYENVQMAGQVIANDKEKIDKDVSNILKLVDLWDKKDYFPAQFSGGELQRLAIARAIVNGPDILFADEPTGNLDPKYAWQIVSLLKTINKHGTTVIMASHNMDIVDSLQQRVIRLKDGKIMSDKKKGAYK